MARSTAGLLTRMSVSVILGQCLNININIINFNISLQAGSSRSSATIQHDNTGDLWGSSPCSWSQSDGAAPPHQASLITNILTLRFQRATISTKAVHFVI